MTVIYPSALGVLYSTDIMRVGWLSCAVGGGTLAGQVFGGMFAMRIGFLKWQMVFMAVMMTVFIGGLAAQITETEAYVEFPWGIYPILISNSMSIAFATLSCFAVGYIELLAATAATFVIRNQKQMGTSNGIFGSIRSAGGVLATTIYLTILTNTMTSNTQQMVVPAVLNAGLPQSSLEAFLIALNSGVATAIEAVPGVSESIVIAGSGALVSAYTNAFQKVFLASIAFGVLSIIASVVLKPISKEQLAGTIVFHLGENKSGNKGPGNDEARGVEAAPLD